jgi:molybdate transport system substrate-binding protein
MRLLRLALLAILLARPAISQEVTVFAAASLKEAMDDVSATWKAAAGGIATISYAGSSALARQIEAGAPADLFVSANVEWMDLLQEEGLIAAGTRTDLVGNALVLIASREAEPTGIADLPIALGDGRLAMALYDAVPAGIYGRQALTSLGVWDALVDRVAQADNVRAALELVAMGEAAYGVVYATDADAEPRVRVVEAFPAGSYPPIVYPAAVTTEGDGEAARAFLDFLQGPEVDAVFLRHGFTLR